MSMNKLLYSGPNWQVDLYVEILEQNGIQYECPEIDSSLFSLSGQIYVSENDFNNAETLINKSKFETSAAISESENIESLNENKSDETIEPTPFRISIPLFIILWIITFGLFQLFWLYKHWTYLKAKDKNNFYPYTFIPLLFSGAFFFVLFHRYYKLIDSDNANYTYLSVLFPLLNIILILLEIQFSHHLWFVYLLGFINFIHLQLLINKGRS